MFTYMQGKLGCLCCMLNTIVGIWSRFDVFVPIHTFEHKLMDVRTFDCKANCAFIAFCTSFTASLYL